MKARIETLAVGDELLSGTIADSNSVFLARELDPYGVALRSTQSIPDDEIAIRAALAAREGQCDAVICFGGLGPTSDDRTVDAVAQWLDSAVVFDGASRAKMEERYRDRGLPITDTALRQVRYPAAATVLPNPRGLAPAFFVERAGTWFVFLPGVPWEMEAIVRDSVVPQLVARHRLVGGRRRTWRCLGVGESQLQEALADVEARLQGQGGVLRLGYRTWFPENHVTLYAPTDLSLAAEVAALHEAIDRRLAEWAYSTDGKSLEESVAARLLDGERRVAFAESCTAGRLAARLTLVPKATSFFWGSWAVYDVDAKRAMLGVGVSKEEAVSAATSAKLALAARDRSAADFSVAVTGYLGPDPGTEADPAGTSYVAVAAPSGIVAEGRFFHPHPNREQAQWAASSRALGLLLKALRH